MQAVIMVAGMSTRTYPLTLTKPKPLLKILNKPILFHTLDNLPEEVEEVIYIVGYLKEMIIEAVGNTYKGKKIIFIEQREQKGTGHALLQAKSYVKGDFMLLNGDDIFAAADLKSCLSQSPSLLAQIVTQPKLYGICKVDDHRLIELEEKPDNPSSNLANTGCYSLPYAIFDYLEQTKPSPRGEIEITSALQALAASIPITVVSTEQWMPTSYPWDMLKATESLLPNAVFSNEGDIEEFAVIKGGVSIGSNTVIRSGSYIMGPVMIGENCIIGPNCFIRPYTVIGNHCHIGNGVEVKNSIVGDNTAIGHLSYVGDSIIGSNVNFGAGTITANLRNDQKEIIARSKGKKVFTGRNKLGAIIGDNVKLGINTSIYPGRMIAPNSFTLPGEVVDRNME